MGADVNYTAPDGARPIHMAVQGGNARVLSLLLETRIFARAAAFACSGSSDRDGGAAATAAALAITAAPTDLTTMLEGGETLLMLAVQPSVPPDENGDDLVGGVACLKRLMSEERFFTKEEANRGDSQVGR